MSKWDADVIISGGGPCGLMLSLELGRRDVRTLLFNDKPGTTPHPQAGATQARTMEHYRRLGLSQRIRSLGLPSDWPTDIAYFTRFSEREIARFSQPSSAAAREIVRQASGSWSAAELPHRCSQMLVEQVLREEAEKLPGTDLRFGWTVMGYRDHGDHVAVDVSSPEGSEHRFTGRYLVGADGARGAGRKGMDVSYEGEKTLDRPFLSGQMYSVSFRSKSLLERIPHPRAWQYWSVTPQRRGMMVTLNGDDRFVYITQLRGNVDPAAITDDEVKSFLHAAMGEPFDLEIVSRAPWTAGLALVSEKFSEGRVFLGGDAAHLFTPTGGLGYNTSVDDAVNLGWKLAAAVKGWGGPALLDSYEAERKPLAKRNTGYARMFADSIGRFTVPDYLEEDSERGARARDESGAYLAGHAQREFNIPGVTFGGRYDGSPVIVSDSSEPPPESAGEYVPTACPGGRAPHAWLADGRSLYDVFGFEFTLLQLADDAGPVAPLVSATVRRGVPLEIVNVSSEGLSELYAAKLALIRPDQIVCWRGDCLPDDCDALLGEVTGSSASAEQVIEMAIDRK